MIEMPNLLCVVVYIKNLFIKVILQREGERALLVRTPLYFDLSFNWQLSKAFKYVRLFFDTFP